MLHQPDETSVDAFAAVAAISLVLKLVLLMAIKLIFMHGQSQSLHQGSHIFLDSCRDLVTGNTRRFFERILVYCDVLVSRVDITKLKQLSVNQFEAVSFASLIIRILKYFLQKDLLCLRCLVVF